MGPAEIIGSAVGALATLTVLLFVRRCRPQRRTDIPAAMKGVRILRFMSPDAQDVRKELEESLAVQEVPVPIPGPGEVLVKMSCVPINPSDLGTLAGRHGSDDSGAEDDPHQSLPCGCGLEGSGTVVATGGGWYSGLMGLQGKRVAIASSSGSTWAEYAVAPALQTCVLPDAVSFEQGCSVFVNPLTALSFIDIAKAKKQKALVMTTATSALARMVILLGRREGVTVVGVVRREEQRAALEAIGARVVVTGVAQEAQAASDAEFPAWVAELRAVCAELDCHVAFDAVVGPMTGHVLAALPPRSSLYVFGNMTQHLVGDVRTSDLVFDEKEIKGYYLDHYVKAKNLLQQFFFLNRVPPLLSGPLATPVRTRVPVEKVIDGLEMYLKRMSGGKVLIAFGGSAAGAGAAGRPVQKPTTPLLGGQTSS